MIHREIDESPQMDDKGFMIIEHEVAAIRKLLDAVANPGSTGDLMLFTSADVIYTNLVKRIKEMSPKHARADYLTGKLSQVLECFQSAVMPCPGDETDPAEWIKRADGYLGVAEGEARSFDT